MKKSAVRARIRQLCCLGLGGRLLVATLLRALRELVPSEAAAFYWVDGQGAVRNLYTERLPSSANALTIKESALRNCLIACDEAPDGIATMNVAGAESNHILCALVHEGSVRGLLCFYRSSELWPFGDSERADLASVLRYVACGLAVSDSHSLRGQLAFAFEDSEEEAMLVTDTFGSISFASDNGLRLLLLATASEITLSVLRAARNGGAHRSIEVVRARLKSVEASTTITLDSGWGRFVLRSCRLSDGHGQEARIGMRIQRQVPAILRFVDAMGTRPLSPQQREIALQIALGRSNQEISTHLGVSLNTVAYHVKQLFLRLDVHTRTEAIEKIAG
jgi:DNA-binding NarL/FixJ family response regulator